MITELPPISKAPQRYLQEQIDGRDGDIMTPLGFGAVDKTLKIALTTGYDVDEVIEYFNAEGVIVFSNEPTKYYRFSVYDQIDFERLIRFKTAEVVLHCQPFKFSTTEEPLTFAGGEDQTVKNSGNYFSKPTIAVSGSGVSTMRLNDKEPITIDFGDSQQNIVIDSEDMNAYYIKNNIKDIRCNINPKQDLNGYDSVWVGGAGKNKVDFPSYANASSNGLTIQTTGDGGFKVSGTPTLTWALLTASIDVDIPANTLVTFGINTALSHRVYIYAVYDDNTTINLIIDTPATSTSYRFAQHVKAVRLDFASLSTSTNYNETIYPMLEYGSTQSPFEPYENICDIEGFNAVSVDHRGKNLFNKENYQNLYSVYDFAEAGYRCRKIQLAPNTTYTVSTTTSEAQSFPIILINNNTAVNTSGFTDLRATSDTKTYTTDATGCLYIGLYPNVSDSVYNDRLNACSIQIEQGTTATTYEPYNGTKYLPYFEGLLNGSYGFVDLGTLSWSYASSIFHANMTGENIKYHGNLACPIYKNQTVPLSNPPDMSISVENSQANPILRITNSDYTDADDFTTAMNGVYLIYELASPVELPTISQEQLNELLADFGANYPTVMLTQSLAGGLSFAQAFEGAGGYSLDTTNKTVTFQHASPVKKIIDLDFKENTVYTISLNYTAQANNTSLIFFYTDGTSTAIALPKISSKSTVIKSTSEGKTLDYVGLSYYSNSTVTLYYNECGLYENTFGGKVYSALLDVNTGLLTLDKGIKYLSGNETWYYTATLNRVYTPVPDAKRPQLYAEILSNALHYSYTQEDYGAYINDQGNLIIFAPSTITSADEWKTWLANNNDIQIIYELANPVTIQVEPKQIEQFLGVNTLSHNANGTIEVDYKHDGEEITTEGVIVSFNIDSGDLEIGELANRLVSGNYDNIILKKGDNTIGFSGNVNGFSVEKYSRWL